MDKIVLTIIHREKKKFKKKYMEEKLREKEEIYDDKCQKTNHLLLGIDYKWHSDAFWNNGLFHIMDVHRNVCIKQHS